MSRWTVRILEATDHRGRTVFDVVATDSEAKPWENPDHFLGTYDDLIKARIKSLVGARLFAQRRGLKPEEVSVSRLPERRGAA